MGRLEFSEMGSRSHIAIVDQPASKRVRGGSREEARGLRWRHAELEFLSLRRQLRRAATRPAASADLPFLAARRARIPLPAPRHGDSRAHYRQRWRPGDEGGADVRRSDIDAVEMVGTVGPARHRPLRRLHRPDSSKSRAVHVHVGEGRSFLRASPGHTTSSRCSATTRRRAWRRVPASLIPSYLHTSEAFVEYFTAPEPRRHPAHQPSHVSAHHRDGRRGVALARPRRLPIARGGVRETVSRGRSPADDADQDVALDGRRSRRPEPFFSMPVDHETPFTLVENPLDAAQSFLPDAFYSGDPVAARSCAARRTTSTPSPTTSRISISCVDRGSRSEPDHATGLNSSTASLPELAGSRRVAATRLAPALRRVGRQHLLRRHLRAGADVSVAGRP